MVVRRALLLMGRVAAGDEPAVALRESEEFAPGARRFDITDPDHVPHKIWLWATTRDLGVISRKPANYWLTHPSWFSKEGLPASGPGYDRIPRGFAIDRGNKVMDIVSYHSHFAPNDVHGHFIAKGYHTRDLPMDPETPSGSFVKSIRYKYAYQGD